MFVIDDRKGTFALAVVIKGFERRTTVVQPEKPCATRAFAAGDAGGARAFVGTSSSSVAGNVYQDACGRPKARFSL